MNDAARSSARRVDQQLRNGTDDRQAQHIVLTCGG
jgi:hypothetical protein